MSAGAPTLKLLFSSNIRVRILSHFFFHPGESYHVRHLADELGEHAGAVGRELKNLERAGILKSRSVGNQKHYSPEPRSPILEELRRIFLKTSGASAQLRDALKKRKDIECAFIYGSFASGDAHVNSDIDVMVVGGVSDRELAPIIARTERRVGREINYSLFTRQEIDQRKGNKGDFVHEVFAGPKLMLIE